jgi:hypothetical protein
MHRGARSMGNQRSLSGQCAIRGRQAASSGIMMEEKVPRLIDGGGLSPAPALVTNAACTWGGWSTSPK